MMVDKIKEWLDALVDWLGQLVPDFSPEPVPVPVPVEVPHRTR